MSLSSYRTGVRASATARERVKRSSLSHARDVTLVKVNPDILSREVMAESDEAPSPHPFLHPRPHPLGLCALEITADGMTTAPLLAMPFRLRLACAATQPFRVAPTTFA